MVEADPPAMPARKEDSGALLVGDGVVGCWYCCVCLDDDGDAAPPESIIGVCGWAARHIERKVVWTLHGWAKMARSDPQLGSFACNATSQVDT